MEFETVIGLETHIQLSTDSKIFCGSSAAFGGAPNSHSDPLTLGLPGSLPVLNRQVVEFAIMMGLATRCEIRESNHFARKHYFYPDLPKGYQISQFEAPICERGRVKIAIDGSQRSIGITRIHMEEDAGKTIHNAASGKSYIDLNRAGTPLLEVVSEPDLRSPVEASAYLKTLRQIVRWLGISDGNMEEGSLRCDANVSLRPVGEMAFGTRTEIKNLNSFKFVEKALVYEVARQLKLLKSGKPVIQETRLFDSDAGVTIAMRGKEESADYRYFPDPDLPPLRIKESWIQDIKRNMPALPEQRVEELISKFSLSAYDAGVLTAEKAYVDYFDSAISHCKNARAVCSWITTEIFGYLKRNHLEFSDFPVEPERLARLIFLIDKGVISGKIAKTVFEEMCESGEAADAVVERKGLKQLSDPGELRKIVLDVFKEFPEQLAEFRGGNEKLQGFFVGQIMKKTRGSANPQLVNKLLLEEKQREN